MVSMSKASSVADSETPSKAAKSHRGRADRPRAEPRHDFSFGPEVSVFEQAGVQTSSIEPELPLAPIEEEAEVFGREEESEEDEHIAKPAPRYPQQPIVEDDDDESESLGSVASRRRNSAGRDGEHVRRAEAPDFRNSRIESILSYLTAAIKYYWVT